MTIFLQLPHASEAWRIGHDILTSVYIQDKQERGDRMKRSAEIQNNPSIETLIFRFATYSHNSIAL